MTALAIALTILGLAGLWARAVDERSRRLQARRVAIRDALRADPMAELVGQAVVVHTCDAGPSWRCLLERLTPDALVLDGVEDLDAGQHLAGRIVVERARVLYIQPLGRAV